MFSVGLPEAGYKWRKDREDERDGIKAAFFKCAKEGNEAVVVLNVQFWDVKAKNDGFRIAMLKAQYNGLLIALKDQNFTVTGGVQPNLVPPIADQAPFSLTAQEPNGKLRCNQCMVIFGRYLYAIGATAQTDADAKRLLDQTLMSFKELSD